MASPAALEEPTIETSWRAFLAHLPTLLLIWLVSAAISLLGLVVTQVILLGGLGANLSGRSGELAETLTVALAQIGQLPFSILSALVAVLLTAVPALHYASGRVIGVREAFQELRRRPGRYLLAGLVFSLATAAGLLLCLLPGIAVLLVMPVYVNLIFTGDRPIADAFQASFHACYGTPAGRSFVLAQLLTWLVVITVSLCTCFVGTLVVQPMACFYLQNLAYHRGVLR